MECGGSASAFQSRRKIVAPPPAEVLPILARESGSVIGPVPRHPAAPRDILFHHENSSRHSWRHPGLAAERECRSPAQTVRRFFEETSRHNSDISGGNKCLRRWNRSVNRSEDLEKRRAGYRETQTKLSSARGLLRSKTFRLFPETSAGSGNRLFISHTRTETHGWVDVWCSQS